MTNTNIIAVLDAIGNALETKNTEISVLQFNLESTKKALAKAEAEVQELQEALHNSYYKTGTVCCDGVEGVEIPTRPEVTA